MLNLDYSFLNWGVVQSFVAKGFWFSIQLTLVAMIGGIVLGTLLAMMRLSSHRWLSAPAAFYVDTLRSIPLVMVILWFFLLIPKLLGPLGGQMSAFITFTLFEATYYSEIMRAGIQSVSKGQVNAGYALGMNYAQTMKLVVLPQALRITFPPLLSQTLNLWKNTSIATVIGTAELMYQAQRVESATFRGFETFALVTAAYLSVSLLLTALAQWAQARLSPNGARR